MMKKCTTYLILALIPVVSRGGFADPSNDSIPQIAQLPDRTEIDLNKTVPLYIGWASVDITPDKPVALVGQLHKRISQNALDPITATVLALETRDDKNVYEQAIMISCDVINTNKEIQHRLRESVESRIPDFDIDQLFMNATHTHTAPGFSDDAFNDLYDVSHDAGVMQASEYAALFIERVTPAIETAWKNRKLGGISWGLGHAVVGMNRRSHYFDGTTAMYGNTNQENFSNLEGYEDHSVELLFCWDDSQELTGTVVNIACPSQETEGLLEISADFWHDVRIEIRKRLAKDIFVFPQCAAAGDISPHLMYRKSAEELMKKRRGLTNRQDIARRICDAVEDVLLLAREDIHDAIVFKHLNVQLDLPPHDSFIQPFYKTDPIAPIEFHVLRLGDVALATNPFELYLDYGVRIKARSPALLTFLVQLSCQNCGYLPTEKAIQGGGYSADQFIVGPKGGQILVDETVKRLNSLWD